jgi:tripartite-type tricarboxylate transporter receptor subunit TctC
MNRRLRLCATLAGLLTATAVPAQSGSAGNYPARPVRFLMTAPAGSSIEVIGRLLAEKLREPLGQPVLVEPRPGAGGTLATDLAAKAAPDGYTMVLSFNGPLSFGPHLYAKLAYDPLRDLAPVILTTSQPNLLVVNAAFPAASVRDLIAELRRNPGRYNYASVGNGSSSHLTMELLKAAEGLFVVHIPFNGSPPAAASVAANETQLLFAVPTAITPLLQAGRVRAIAVSGTRRYALLPDIPTLAEGGVAKFEALAWNGVLFPAGTPRPVIERMNREMNAALRAADVRERLNAAGLEPAGGTPEEFAQLIRTESEKWGPIIRRTGAKID